MLTRKVMCLFSLVVLAGLGCQGCGSKATQPLTATRPEKAQPTEISSATLAVPHSRTPSPAAPTHTPIPPTPTGTPLPPTHTSSPTPRGPDLLAFAPENQEKLQLLALLSNSHLGAILDVAWSPDGTRLTVVGTIGLTLLDAGTMEAVWNSDETLSEAEAFFSSDSSVIVIHNSKSSVKMIDAVDGHLLREVDSYPIIALSPDGSLLAMTDGDYLDLVDVESGETVMSLESDYFYSGPILGMAFSADSKKLLAGCADGDVQVWDTETGERTRSFDSGMLEPYSCYNASGTNGDWLMLNCQYPSDDYQVVNHQIWLWDLDNDKNQRVYTLTDKQEIGYYGFAASPGGKKLAMFAGENVEVWNLPGGFGVERRWSMEEPWNGLAFSPTDDGRTLAVWGDHKVQLWDVPNKQLQGEFVDEGEVTAAVHVAFRPATGTTSSLGPDGRLLAVGRNSGLVELWDVASGQKVQELAGHTHTITGLAFSADGNRLATGSFDGTAFIWDMAVFPPQQMAQFQFPRDLYALALSPDGRQLALSGKLKTVDLWDVDTKTKVGELEVGDTTFPSLAFSPDGTILAVGDKNGFVQLWDVTNRQLIHNLHIADDRWVAGLAFSPDQRMLAVIADEKLQVWEVASGTWIRGWRYDTTANAIAFSPDQCTLAISELNITDFLDVSGGEFYSDVSVDYDGILFESLSFSSDGYLLASGGINGITYVWGVPGGLASVNSMPASVRCGQLPPPPTPTPTPIPSPTQPPTATPLVSPTATPTPPPFTRTLSLQDPPMTGDDVYLLQQRLVQLGYTEVSTPDGVFGKNTDQAVRHFQERNNLEADGFVGPKTWERLFSDDAIGAS